MRLTLAMLLTAAALTACGSDGADGALDWPASRDVAGADSGLVWADAPTGDVHLADGSTLAGDRAISSFVVAGRGAYVVDDDSALVEVTADGSRATGAHVDQRLRASPGGRYLAFIDPLAGPLYQEDPAGDVHQMTSVVVDLETGQEIFRSTRGMGDPQEDDLVDLYEDASYGVLGLTDDTAWIEPATGDVLAIDLASGDVSTVPDDPSGDRQPWETGTISPPTTGGAANPDRTWGIYHVTVEDPDLSDVSGLRFSRDELEPADGQRVVPRPDARTWSFEQWIDESTVAGFANPGLGDPDRITDPLPRSVMTCTVPDGSCTIVPDSDGAILPEPSLS